MKTITLTVEIRVIVKEDVDPSDITFRGIENAVPTVKGKDVGTVDNYCTQEYFGEEP